MKKPHLSSSSWTILAMAVSVALWQLLPFGPLQTISRISAFAFAGALVVSLPPRQRWWGVGAVVVVMAVTFLYWAPRQFLETNVTRIPLGTVPSVDASVVPGGESLNVHPPGKSGGTLTVCFYENGYAVAAAHPCDFPDDSGWALCVDCLSQEMVEGTPTFVADTPVGIVISGMKCPTEGRAKLPLAAPDEIEVGQTAQVLSADLGDGEVEVLGFTERKEGQFLVFRPASSSMSLGPGSSGTPLVQNGKIIGFIAGRLALDFSSRKLGLARLAPDVYAGTKQYWK